MPKVELDEIEKFLVEAAWEADSPGRDETMTENVKAWVHERFAELRAREDAKAFM